MNLKQSPTAFIFLFASLVMPIFGGPWTEDLGPLGKVVLETHTRPGSSAHFDRLVLTPVKAGEKPREIFNSNGQELIRVEKTDLNQDGVPELFITMDTGGSGGFIEYVLLAPANGAFTPFEIGDAFKAGEARIEPLGPEGRKAIIISFLGDQEHENSPPPRVESGFTYADGKIVPLSPASGKAKP